MEKKLLFAGIMILSFGGAVYASQEVLSKEKREYPLFKSNKTFQDWDGPKNRDKAFLRVAFTSLFKDYNVLKTEEEKKAYLNELVMLTEEIGDISLVKKQYLDKIEALKSVLNSSPAVCKSAQE